MANAEGPAGGGGGRGITAPRSRASSLTDSLWVWWRRKHNVRGEHCGRALRECTRTRCGFAPSECAACVRAMCVCVCVCLCVCMCAACERLCSCLSRRVFVCLCVCVCVWLDFPFCPKDTEQVKRLCQSTERYERQRRNLTHTRNADWIDCRRCDRNKKNSNNYRKPVRHNMIGWALYGRHWMRVELGTILMKFAFEISVQLWSPL